MSGIWVKGDDDWKTAPSQKFESEDELHCLVERNIQMLPLAGSPRLAVIGREVHLGSGRADLMAVETTGRPVIIEVKLARNSEARRAVVAQALNYAAYLKGYEVEDLEKGPLREYLRKTGAETILGTVKKQDQEGAVNDDDFVESLREYLANGGFRLVLLLDEAPDELKRIVGYLDAVTSSAVTLDLIAIGRHTVCGTEVVLPRRVSLDPTALGGDTRKAGVTRVTAGSGVFEASISDVEGEERETLDRLVKWAKDLADLPGVHLSTFKGVKQVNLFPNLHGAWGLAWIRNHGGKPSLHLTRSVFERMVPGWIDKVENLTGETMGKGTKVPVISTELLAILTKAYEEADGS